jgi:hypothetical protein
MPSLLSFMSALKEDNYLMKALFPYWEFLHYFRLNVPTFVELYLFGIIRCIKENNVKFWMLFKKCTKAFSSKFCRNHSTFVVSSQNVIFAPFFECCFGLSNFIDFYGQSISRLLQLLVVWIFQIIGAPFRRGWKIRMKIKSHQIHAQLLNPA